MGTWKRCRVKDENNLIDQHVSIYETQNCIVVVGVAPTETNTVGSNEIETGSGHILYIIFTQKVHFSISLLLANQIHHHYIIKFSLLPITFIEYI